ncbi:hypothetical protein OAG62_01620, partial [bacterium]|nr:hypothetical protein [bacterium]
MMPSRFPTSSGSKSRVPKPRGNTLVLVTVILVLLVIIAVAFISRTQGGRVIAAAQRKAIDREDRAEIAVGAVQDLVGGDLFPGLVDPSDPLVQGGLAASSATPTLSLDSLTLNQGGNPVTQEIVRYGVDPSGFDAAIGTDSLAYPYNFAPFQTVPWTNWPDVPDVPGADGNLFPYGPGNLGGVFIADSNPFGNPGFGDSRWLRSSEPQRFYADGRPANFSHWTHLSWIATAENGIRVCKDISNIATLDQGGGTIARTFPDVIRDGYMGTYAEYVRPLALQTPYEQWLPGNIPFTVFPTTQPSRFLDARDAWFGRPSSYANAMYNGGLDLLPNFIHLESLGPKSDEGVYLPNPADWPIRKAVASTLADADGDGFTDSFWFVLPGVSEDGIRQVAAVSIIDNASMVDVNTATRFDRWSTAGHTPADVALTSKLFAEWPNGNDFDTLDTLTGLLSDPQNGTVGLFRAGCETGPNQGAPIGTSYDPGRFDGIFTGGAPFAGETSWTDEVGVTANGDFIAPYRTPLAAFDDFDLVLDTAQRDRRRYFQRRLTKGGLSLDRYDPSGEIWKNPARFGLENIPTRQFANGDELELRMFAGNGYGPIVSRLERTIERPWGTSSVSSSNPDRYRYNPLRSTLTRSENVSRSFVNDICASHQLDAEQLLFDTRHRMTTYSATRNDLVPLHQRPTPLYVAGWLDPSRGQMGVLDDYAFGRIMNRFSQADVLATYRQVPPGIPLTDTELLLREFSEKAFEDRSLKLDLRAALDGPITAFESVLYSEDPNNDGFLLFPHGVFNPINRIPPGDRFVGDLREGLWPGQAEGTGTFTTPFKEAIEIDREIRFRQRLESILAAELASAVELDPVNFPGEYTFQSYLQDQYAPVVGGHNNTEL